MKLIRFGVAFVVVVTASGLVWALADRAKSVAEIEKTLEATRTDLHSAEDELARYEPSLVQALIAIRVQTTKMTIAMLEQKRASWFHRIDLRYTIDGKSFPPEVPSITAGLEREIQAAETEIRDAGQEGAQYSGGLIKIMIEVRKATAESKLAMLKMRLVAARYGMPLFDLTAKEGQKNPGEVKSDEDTL